MPLMQSLYFVTGNAGKLSEFQALLPQVQGIDLALTEIQHSDPEAIIAHKLAEAQQQTEGRYPALLVEDTSLYLDCLGGLPGPLIKWFIAPQHLGVAGLAQVAERMGNPAARAVTLIGLQLPQQAPIFVRGEVAGQIVTPRGSQGFGWDAIFQPQGAPLTFAEMDPAEKARWSMRRLAIEALVQHLSN